MSLNLPKRAKRLRQRDVDEDEGKKISKKERDRDGNVQSILDEKKQRREFDNEVERVGIL